MNDINITNTIVTIKFLIRSEKKATNQLVLVSVTALVAPITVDLILDKEFIQTEGLVRHFPSHFAEGRLRKYLEDAPRYFSSDKEEDDDSSTNSSMEEEEEEEESDHPNDSEDPKQSSNRRDKDDDDDLPPPNKRRSTFAVKRSLRSTFDVKPSTNKRGRESSPKSNKDTSSSNKKKSCKDISPTSTKVWAADRELNRVK